MIDSKKKPSKRGGFKHRRGSEGRGVCRDEPQPTRSAWRNLEQLPLSPGFA